MRCALIFAGVRTSGQGCSPHCAASIHIKQRQLANLLGRSRPYSRGSTTSRCATRQAACTQTQCTYDSTARSVQEARHTVVLGLGGTRHCGTAPPNKVCSVCGCGTNCWCTAATPAHAAAGCQALDALKPVGTASHYPPKIMTRPPHAGSALVPPFNARPITRPPSWGFAGPCSTHLYLPRRPIREAVFAWPNLLCTPECL